MAEIKRRYSESRPREMTDVEEHFASENVDYDEDDQWFLPFTDFYEDDKHFYLDIEMPGVEDKDVHINIENSEMIVSGMMTEEEEEDEEMLIYTEYDDGSFHRHFTLADGINSEKIKAKLDKGLLTISLPKKDEYKVKKIPVKSR
jgi:HSP20 family protein